MAKDLDALKSPTQGILSFANWSTSPFSNGNTFWTFNTGSTPTTAGLHDSLKTPARGGLGFGLTGTPNGMAKFWEHTTIATTPIDAGPSSSGKRAAEPPTIVELPASEETFNLASPPRSNKANDSAYDDVTAPPTPKSQENSTSESAPSLVVSRSTSRPTMPNQSPLATNESTHHVSRITKETTQVQDCGDFSILSKTHVSIIPNSQLPPDYRDIVKQEAIHHQGPSSTKYLRLSSPNSVKREYIFPAQVKIESPTSLGSLPTLGENNPPHTPRPKKQLKEKKYKCEWANCDKAFYRADELKRHTRVHTKEKPFPCPHCDRHFARSDHVRTHVRIHTGEKPYKCDYCSKCFARSDERLRHHKVHEKRLKKEEEARLNQVKMEAGYMNYGQQPRALTYYAHPQQAIQYSNSPPPPPAAYNYPVVTSNQAVGIHHYQPSMPQQQQYQRAPLAINNVPVTSVIEVPRHATPQPSYYQHSSPNSRNPSWEQTRVYYNQN
jgi:uncharacterized Zn-finger protein